MWGHGFFLSHWKTYTWMYVTLYVSHEHLFILTCCLATWISHVTLYDSHEHLFILTCCLAIWGFFLVINWKLYKVTWYIQVYVSHEHLFILTCCLATWMSHVTLYDSHEHLFNIYSYCVFIYLLPVWLHILTMFHLPCLPIVISSIFFIQSHFFSSNHIHVNYLTCH